MVTSSHTHIEGLVAAMVEGRTGLFYRPLEHEIFAQKLRDHLEDIGAESLTDFYYHLRYDDGDAAALDRLIEALLVHETYFFREMGPLVVAIDRIVAPIVSSGRHARIWSAACSTGEEPLSLAILLAERGILDRCEIVASDVSERVLAAARAGEHRGRALRSDGLDLAERWLVKRDGMLTTPQRLRDVIDFRRVNLCDATEVAALGRFDLVVCRNVLIYFDDATIGRVLASIGDTLHDGGVLLVGVSESLLRFSTQLRCEEIDHAFMYRKAP